MPVGNNTLELDDVVQPDREARMIVTQFMEWETFRNMWMAQKREITEYVYATDTSGTTNVVLPWKNSTHVPKLCQIYDNLQANYMAALFPNDRPIKWEGDDESSEAKDKREAIEAYMENKMRLGSFRSEIAKCVNDFILYGNVFSTIEFVAEKTTDAVTGEEIPGYTGPKLVRISPMDIVFNPTTASFASTPKIIRSLRSMGSIKKQIAEQPEAGYLKDVFEKMRGCRNQLQSMNAGDFNKSSSFQIDGFSSYLNYFQSDYVEVLDFYGDYYDNSTDTLYENYQISVVDRAWIIRKEPNPSWLGTAPIYHVGWRLRPDNLYAMGPLDNLVGMQYRIDHLENARADAFDLIVHPVMKIKGFVEDFEYEPGARIFMGEEGDVAFMMPDTTMLQADTQIQLYESKMEEMAGAPKQAMGFRTPGEKTAYEVQILENGSNRIFINKTSYFEENFVEPILNGMLEMSRRNMGVSDLLRVEDDQFGAVNFLKITRDDITARGKIRPIGARHFARNANIVQNLTQFQSTMGQDPSINAHVSGKILAHTIFDLMDLGRYKIVQDNIRVAEQLETQQLASAGKQILMEQMGQQPGATPSNANPMVSGPPQGPTG